MGADEEGTVGARIYRDADDGRHSPAGRRLAGFIRFFDPAGTVTGHATARAEARPPVEPPWPGSPVAAH